MGRLSLGLEIVLTISTASTHSHEVTESFLVAKELLVRHSRMIRIWSFEKSPQHLQQLYSGALKPQWVAEVPRAMNDQVQEVWPEVFRCSGSDSAAPCCRISSEGNFVYFGSASLATIPSQTG
jgi:hypothetical protein